MEKFKVSFEANNQQLKSLGTKHASDTYADIEATFILGEKWTDMDSVSAVWWNDFTRIATVLDSQGKCIVPHEVLTRKGCVRVNLVGSIVEGDELITRLTSYSAEAVQVNEKIKLTGSETSEITPSQYEQFVANVKADADRAEAGATASANSADEAEASAQNASESASASAVSASDSARSATASAGYAQNASEIAVEVEVMKNEVELAKDKVLGMRATAETLEAGSDATASYSDGLLTLGIPRGDQGIQGIQGETGATPNLTIGTVETLEPTEDATATITGTAENPVLNLGLPKGDTGEVSLEDLEALLPTDTASGDIVSITDGQSVVPVKSLKVTLEPIQSGSGDPSPSNIRPISGHTEVDTHRTGKNLFDANANPNKWIVADGTLSTVTGAGTSDKIETNGKVLTFTTSYANGYSGILCITGYDSSDNLVNRSAINGANSITFTTTAEMSYIRASHYNNADFQLELGSTATDYEPYEGETYHTELEGNYTVVGTDNEPYLFKAVDGINGDRLRENIVGGTVNWNQKADELTLANKWKVNEAFGTATYGDNSIKYTITSKQTSQYIGRNNGDGGLPLIQNHKYFIGFGILSTEALTSISSCVMNDQVVYWGAVEANAFIRKERIFNSTQATGGNAFFGIYPNLAGGGMNVGMEFTISDLCVFDLTQMLGTTIADYIYSLEQTTAGAGVAWFKSLFPNDYYEYNSGELMSVNASAHVIKDSGGNVLGNYPLDSSLTLRGIPKLNASNNLYYDGDVYKSDGSVTRKYGIVDLGTLTWIKGNRNNDDTAYTFYCNYSGMKFNDNFVATNLSEVFPALQWEVLKLNEIYKSANNIVVALNESTASAAKAALNGVYLVYELATPTEETAEPFEEIQKFINGGTLQYLTDGIVPVGHETEYLSRVTYGCTIDLVSGELVVDRAMVDLGTLNWTINGRRFLVQLMGAKGSATDSTVANIVCSCYEAVTNNQTYGGTAVGISLNKDDNAYCGVYDPIYTDVATFKTAVSGQTLCYELATPQTIQLTPQEVQLLLGTNNIWSDGEVTLVYNADIQKWVEKKLQS